MSGDLRELGEQVASAPAALPAPVTAAAPLKPTSSKGPEADMVRRAFATYSLPVAAAAGLGGLQYARARGMRGIATMER